MGLLSSTQGGEIPERFTETVAAEAVKSQAGRQKTGLG